MESINSEINSIHEAFCSAACQEMPLNVAFERYWRDALAFGVTPDDVRLCVKSRIRFNMTSSLKKSLSLFKLISSEDGLAMMVSEAAEARALMRLKVMPKGKAEAMRATGRSDEMPTSEPRSVKEILPGAIEALRKAVG